MQANRPSYATAKTFKNDIQVGFNDYAALTLQAAITARATSTLCLYQQNMFLHISPRIITFIYLIFAGFSSIRSLHLYVLRGRDDSENDGNGNVREGDLPRGYMESPGLLHRVCGVSYSLMGVQIT